MLIHLYLYYGIELLVVVENLWEIIQTKRDWRPEVVVLLWKRHSFIHHVRISLDVKVKFHSDIEFIMLVTTLV